ncbi:purine-nucleoside phosphorylase [Peptostreptococcus canis]|uniref:Purine nucleoside phosphorylase n=1 Tax=Peptostreptococcus canis TaxID=1159213 RepID=A0ABR6TMW4_9FIRM|nr:purine-nucleoside phosphorylase [Peptostreptococcus canis]MBC2576483.1 purine-nucleoside phosphorylase [Peptostreptococcus canis]MBP1998681.1 purine-nucleoside phosphorylase [Peptostreptococcus canis]
MLSLVQESVNYINSKINCKPEIVLILGSGLGDLADEVENPTIISYKDIPNFKSSNVEGHKSQLVIGKFYGKNVLIMQGRFHYYEGYSQAEITYPIRVFKEMEIDKILVTNAAGGCNKDFKPGDLMIIKDHINFSGRNPLIGPNDEKEGPRFPDMSEAYSKKGIELIKKCAEELNIVIKEGVYMFFSGPSYETPSEIKMASILGADAVGMSTVPEVIVSKYCGMEVFGISCITNMAAGITYKPLNHKEVIETTKVAKEKFSGLVRMLVTKI